MKLLQQRSEHKHILGLIDEKKIQELVDIKATNIVLQGLPQDIYNLVNHNEHAKQIWDKVKLLIQGFEISLQERESKLYDDFDTFTSMIEEIIHSYYMRFAKLIIDMHTIGMTMKPLQVNTKFVNHLQPEWRKFVTNVKLAKYMHTIKFDHLYAHLRQYEAHANEVHLSRQRRITCGYPWPELEGKRFGMIQERLRLSKRKFVIVFHEKVVRIPLEGDEILRVHGERTQGVVKTLMNTKVVEFRVDLVPGATPVAKSPYRLAPLEMQELSEQLQELQDEVVSVEKKWRVKLRRVRAMSMTIQSSVKDKILATPSETSKVENAPAEMLRDLDQQMEKRADDGKANVVTDALSRKERVKPRRVRAMAMTIQYGVRGMILAAQSELFKQENMCAERLHRFLTSLLDDGRGSGSWMFLFVWSGYAAMRTLLWAGKVVSSLVVPLFVTMPAQRSNEDQAVRISKSIFVTNFPDNLGRRNWEGLRGYGRSFWRGNLLSDWILETFPPLIASVARSSTGVGIDDSFEAVLLGGLWVLIELDNEGSKQKFLDHVGVNSWFCTLLNAYNDFVSDERGEALDIEDNFGSSFARKRLCILTKQPESILEKFKSCLYLDDESKHGARILNDGAQNSDVESDDECNVDGVSETVFSDNVDECNVDGHGKETDKQQSKDPFGFYDLLNKLPAKGVRDASTSLSHPPGFTPKTSVTHANVGEICEDGPTNGEDMVNMPRVDAKVLGTNEKEWVKELNCKHRINFLALQETKMDCISHMDVKSLWGNSNFDFVASDSLGNSGGILCIWEASIFKKDGATISDNFIAIYGTWLPRNVKILLVAVYAPQQPGSKRALWDFLSNLVRRWNGEAIIMNDLISIDKDLERGNVSDDILLNRMDLNRRLQILNLFGGLIVDSCVFSLRHLVYLIEYVKEAILRITLNVRFQQPCDDRLKLNAFHNRLSSDQVDELDRAVSRDEIRRAVWNCGENKSPGPDGYTWILAANRIGCAVLNTPFRYLGVTVGEICPKVVLKTMESIRSNSSRVDSSDRKISWVFPRLFALELDKEIVVANKMGASSVSASFRRDVRDGAERQQWDDLSSILNSVVLSSSKDRWTCDLSGDGEFKVKVIRNFIDDLFLPSSDVETRWEICSSRNGIHGSYPFGFRSVSSLFRSVFYVLVADLEASKSVGL
ncbi:RNA-directed DNA polymerase, eukaryota [Tanacetum coccineum]